MRHIGLNDLKGHAARRWRVIVDPECRRRGIGQSMVRRAPRLAFDPLGLQRFALLVIDVDTSATRLLQLEGLVGQGHLRQARRVGDEAWSLDRMAVLENAWRSRPAASSTLNPGGPV